MTIAVPPLEQNALLYVADHKRFCAEHGLRVVIKDYDSGVTAINGMLKGEADIEESAEFPFVRAVFRKENLRLIGLQRQIRKRLYHQIPDFLNYIYIDGLKAVKPEGRILIV